MPLTRATMTAASRITTKIYPFLFISAGLIYLLQADSRTTGPAFDTATLLWPMNTWAALFIVIGVAETVALIWESRRLYVGALIAGTGLMAFWAVLMLAAALQSPYVSFSAALWLAGIAGFHVASARSIAWKETGL